MITTNQTYHAQIPAVRKHRLNKAACFLLACTKSVLYFLGTSAQQLDASFSTNASLNLFELDLADPSLDMKPCGSFSSTHRYLEKATKICKPPICMPPPITHTLYLSVRYHKLVWGPYGIDGQSHPSGVLIAGGENGNIILYDPAKIMAGASDVVITESDLHTGPVRALDINPFQVCAT